MSAKLSKLNELSNILIQKEKSEEGVLVVKGLRRLF